VSRPAPEGSAGNGLESASTKREGAVAGINDAPRHSEPTAAAGTASPRRAGNSGFLSRYALVVLLFIVLALFSALLPETFFTHANLVALVSGQIPVLILALSLCITLTAGEYDLSVGAAAGFSSVLVVVMISDTGMPFWLAVFVLLLLGITLGTLHWFFTSTMGINSFIVTLGTSTLLAGLTLLLSGGGTISAPKGFDANVLYSYRLADIPLAAFVTLALAGVVWVAFERTGPGRHLLFVGQGDSIARLAGLRVARIRWAAFTLGAVISMLCGLVLTAQIGAANPGIGGNLLLPAFAAVFLGATTVRPGRFNAAGTVVAFYLLNAGVTGFQLLGAESWVEQVFNGAALILAVSFARIVTIRQERMARKGG